MLFVSDFRYYSSLSLLLYCFLSNEGVCIDSDKVFGSIFASSISFSSKDQNRIVFNLNLASDIIKV